VGDDDPVLVYSLEAALGAVEADQGWNPSAIHLANSSMRDSCQGPSPFGGAGGITAPPIPRNAVVDGPSVLFDLPS